MDIFDEELLRLWNIAFKADLNYIMIGGIATNLHGYHPRNQLTGLKTNWI